MSDSRKEFEAAHRAEHNISPVDQYVFQRYASQPEDYVNDIVQRRWEGWQLALSVAPAPVAANPALTVWEGPMPETNGKSNFTAILYRKGGDIVDGITLDCSEYLDRVRYEADRARYLIGELKERPHILDYDPDKHSGYVAPVQEGPKGVEAEESVMVPRQALVFALGCLDGRIQALKGEDLYAAEHKVATACSEALHAALASSAQSIPAAPCQCKPDETTGWTDDDIMVPRCNVCGLVVMRVVAERKAERLLAGN